MHAVHSSTSNSEASAGRWATPSRRCLSVALWTLVWLAVLDVAVNLAFGSTTASDEPSALKRYFEYGRSVEGKLARMAAANPTKGGQMLSAGWTTADVLRGLPSSPAPGDDMLMAVYGQSFSLIAAKEAVRLRGGGITLRGVGGPGAPPSHSYAGYKADAPLRKADVVVFGVLSSAVANMGSLSGLIWMFENPAPFTFPRYRVVAGQLVEEQPLLRSEAEFRVALKERSSAWQAFKEQLRRSDRGYDSATFDASLADASSIVRLMRRGWVAHRHAYEDGVYRQGEGFDPQSEDVQALKLIVQDLKRRTDARGEHLIVLLLHTRGQADHLHAALGRTLDEASIDSISTHTLFSANDPTNFLPDGHYVESANRLLSEALLSHVRDRPMAQALGSR